MQTGMRESGQSWKELLVDLRRGVCQSRRTSRWATGRSAFGRPWTKPFPRPVTNDAAAQDPERSRQAAEVGSAQRASGSARNLALRKPRCRRRRDDDLRREIRAQVRQSRRLPSQGPRRIVDVLRFSCRALDASADINPIESAFATVRHRTVRMKGALSQDTARLMVFKLIMAAAKNCGACKDKISCRRSSAV